MSIAEAFQTLKITQTREEKAIRLAYLTLLKEVNPEDDPDGFKRLREAYEQAVAYAQTPEEEEGMANVQWLQNQAVGAFLQQLTDIYTIFPRRIDLSEWNGLLSDPILDSLDDAETAKWGLFSYLAEHFRLPDRIWRRLDKAFFIQENQKEFREHLPEGFVDYILEKLRFEQEQTYPEFPYDVFVGAPDADYDRFIRDYTNYINQRFDKTEEGFAERKQVLDALMSQGISHPWCEMQLAFYLQDAGRIEEFYALLQKLLEENPKDEHICLSGAEIFEEDGQDEKAYAIYQNYLNREHKTKQGQFRTYFGLARIEAKKGQWVEAKRYADLAKQIGHSDELKEFLKKAEDEIIALYLLKEDDLTEEEVSLLGSCFILSGQWKEGYDFFEKHTEYQKDTASFHEQQANLSMYTGHYQQALEESEQWRACLARDYSDSEEDQEYRKQKTAQSYYVVGCAYGEFYRKNLEKEGAEEELLSELSSKALEAFNQALQYMPENKNILIGKILLLRDLQDDRGVVDVCEQALSYDPNHFQACFFLQEAYENLGMAQQVVDTFYRAKQIYNGNAQIYLRAVNVFLAYQQYQDALRIIQQAEEANVMDHVLLTKKVRAICHMAKPEDKEAFQKAKEYAAEITERLEQEEASADLLADIYLERAYLHESSRKLTNKQKAEIKRFLKKSLKYKDTIDVRYALGRFIKIYEKKAESAYKQLKICKERQMKFKWLDFYIAQCQEGMGNEDKAIQSYEEVMEQDPEFDDAYWRIGWIYRKKLRRTMVKEYGERSLHYFNLQEEKFGVDYSVCRWRSYVWLCLGNSQKALEDSETGLERKKDSGMWLLKARALKNMGRYDEAIECFQTSILCEDRFGEDDTSCYERIFQCYLTKNELKQAVDYFKAELSRVEDEKRKDSCLEHLVQCTALQGDYAQAFVWLEQRYGTLSLSEKGADTWEKTADRIEEVLDLWMIYQGTLDQEYQQKCEDARGLALEAWEDESSAPDDRALVCQNVGETYFYQGGHLEEAYAFFQKTYQLIEGRKDYKYFRSLVNHLMMTCYFLEDLEKAKEYGDMYREKLEEDYKGCEALGKSIKELMSIPGPDARQNQYHLFCYYYFTGQIEQARVYVDLMCSNGMCFWCDEKDCTELWEAKGLLAYKDHNLSEAVDAFEKSNQFCWIRGTRMAHKMLRVIKNQIEY